MIENERVYTEAVALTEPRDFDELNVSIPSSSDSQTIKSNLEMLMLADRVDAEKR